MAGKPGGDQELGCVEAQDLSKRKEGKIAEKREVAVQKRRTAVER